MLNFQEMIGRLIHFWAEQGCIVHQGYDLEVGAGTFNPATFLRCLGPEPYSAVYVEPSRRPKDGRYGENPNRVQSYHQMQVIIKPSPPDLQDLYLQSLEAIGLNLKEHDIRFVHDDWENPTIGAWGLGWEVWADGMEVTQFTYFQSVGGLSVMPVSGELTYGLERLAMYVQGVDSMFDLQWNKDLKYGDITKRSEWEWSHYNFTEADASMWLRHFDDFESEAKRLIRNDYPIPAYDFVMKASHAFNILDARGVISVTERTGYMGRIRTLARQLAESYVASREEQAFPLLSTQKKATPPAATPPSGKWSPDEREDFLLEIGSEELPASFVPVGTQNLERAVTQFLKEQGLSHGEVEVFGTPRRLAILVKGLVGGTHESSVERKGPAIQAAFDDEGVATKAGSGFFRSLGLEPVPLSQIEKVGLEVRTLKGTDYLFANVKKEGVSTRALLAAHLPKLILGIDFPKKMRWGDLDIEYARPIRWIVALYGKDLLPFHVGLCISGATTFGHRQISPDPIHLKKPTDYIDALKKHHVMASIEERRASIVEQIAKVEKETDGEVIAQERVIPQVLHLVEWPSLTVAEFDSTYLKAPKEVLISEMVEHQKYFPVADQKGALKPLFVITCDNLPTEKIRHGNQMALSPRLADGMFLYEADLKTPLDELNEKLKTVTFQKALGSMAEKVKRLVSFVELLHPYFPDADVEKAKRAAALCKADLASELVGEFPDLQGVVGKLYALNQGEDAAVALAIDEHWMPRGERAPLPSSPEGTLVSLAEKIDNLLSCFSVGLQPTSSSDPYALRRQTLGMFKMLITHERHLPLRSLFSKAFELFITNPEIAHKTKLEMEAKKETILDELANFFRVRLKTVFADDAFEKDEVASILERGSNDPFATHRLLTALHTFREKHHAQFLALLEIYTRTKKILLSQNKKLIRGWEVNKLGVTATSENRFPPIDTSLLKESAEKKLATQVESTKKTLHEKLIDRRDVTSHDYTAALQLLSELQPLVTTFFDDVKVVADDPAVRTNRLALLQEVWDLFEELLDFSQIQEHNNS